MKPIHSVFLTTAFALGAFALAMSGPARAAPDEVTQIECNPFLPPHGNFIGCDGDCDLNGTVSIDEIVRIVGIILGSVPPDQCPALPGTPTVADVVQAIPSVFEGCPAVAQYRLTEGSTIAYYAGTPTPSIEEPLSGTFVLVDRGAELQFADSQVTSLNFQAAHFVIKGGNPADIGCAMAGISPPPNLLVSAAVLINDVLIGLSGGGSADCCPFPPPTWSAVQICGNAEPLAPCQDVQSGATAGYALTLFARLDQ